MKFKNALTRYLFVACVVFSTVAFTQSVNACSAIQKTPEKKQEFVEQVEFIGIVEVLKIEKYESGQVKSVLAKPFMEYKSSESFDLSKEFSIEFKDIWTSCDYSPRLFALQEAIIKKDDKGRLVWGSQFDMALGDYWHKLRDKAAYVGD